MAKSLEIIHSEHRRVAAVLNCLEGVLHDVEERGIAPDFELFESVLNYLELFLYRFHHLKEDEHLFRVLRERSAEAGRVLDRLEREHQEGHGLIERLRTTLAAYRGQGAAAFAAFRDAVAEYHRFERVHMSTEEREVLPLARKALTQQDWDELDTVFTAHDDPLFGDRPREEFEWLLSAIVSRAPAPHGLGAPR